MEKHQKSIAVLALMLIFTSFFLRNTKSDLPLIFEKQLHGHDEASNSVVAANITRQFFPPMVRVNPLNEQQGNWMEGPYWQHIPPLFAYVPYIFFQLDGEVSIEVKRLSYALIVLLTGLIFIWGVYQYRKNIGAAVAATIATILWIRTPFMHELITGYAFGVSDIVLAFTVVCSFVAILWYMREEREGRREYGFGKLIVIAVVVATPIMAKNLLGAIPAATFFILLIRDFRVSKKSMVASLSFIGVLLIYYLPYYFSSPETFEKSIFVSIFHFGNLEGWGRPWHYYVTNYLPQRYLFGWTWVYWTGLVLAIVISNKKQVTRNDQILLWLSGGWFLWNLVAISMVESKITNFIFQSYLLSLYFIVYTLTIGAIRICEEARRHVGPPWQSIFEVRLPRLLTVAHRCVPVVLVVMIALTLLQLHSLLQHFRFERAQAYNYQTEFEKFYKTAEEVRSLGLNTNDLVIIRVSDNDCWARYPILFLTGTESKTLLEMHFNVVPYASKYQRVYLLLNKNEIIEGRRTELSFYSLTEVAVDTIPKLINNHQEDIQADILRIKKDKTSCQWLVPDAILNAP